MVGGRTIARIALLATVAALTSGVAGGGQQANTRALHASLTAYAVSAPLTSVSCVSTSFCEAVTYYGDVTTYDGSSWSKPVAVGAAPLMKVTCASPSLCLAIDVSGEVVTFDGSTWSAPNLVDGTNSLYDVSCTGPSFCMGISGVPSSVFLFDGTTWSAESSPATWISNISCSSPTSCLALDLDVIGSNPAVDKASAFDGSTWTTVAIPTFEGAQALSCPSSSFCMAVGGGSAAVALVYDGTAWSRQQPKSMLTSPALDSVSCTSPTFCVATAASFKAFVFDGTTWSTPPTHDKGAKLRSVSCVSPTFCVAVDSEGDALTYNGSTWSTPASVEYYVTTDSLPDASRGVPYGALLDVVGAPPTRSSWRIVAGSLPAGLRVREGAHMSTGGILSGTPRATDAPGTYTFTVMVKTKGTPTQRSQTAVKELTLTLT